MSSGPVSAIEYRDARIGVTYRTLCNEDDQPDRFLVDFESQKSGYARLGQVYKGRVVGKDPGGGGVFVDIGVGPQGYLRYSSPPPEGAACVVRVVTEARDTKGPVLVRASVSKELGERSDLGILAEATEDPFHRGFRVDEIREGVAARDMADLALDLVAAESHLLPTGACVSIEPTKALVAVDIDSSGVLNRGDREQLANSINLEAMQAIVRLLSLKSLAGIVVVDFLKLSDKGLRKGIQDAFRAQATQLFGKRVEIAPISSLGLLEAALPHGARPVEEVLGSIPDIERSALALLDEAARMGVSDRGARLEIIVSKSMHDWLESEEIGWKDQLVQRIGPRFVLRLDGDLEFGKERVRIL